MGTTSAANLAARTKRPMKGHSLLDIPSDYVVIDLETTGLDPRWDEIIEVASARVIDGEIVDTFHSLVHPECEVSDFITELTGITNEMLLEAPVISEVLLPFLEFAGDSIVVGHNVNFDVNFIYDNCLNSFGMTFSNDFIDTMRISRRLFKEHRHHRLSDLIERFGIGETVDHRALSDVVQTHKCYEFMRNYSKTNNIPLFTCPWKNYPRAKDICPTKSVFDEDSLVYGKTFVFTGALERMVRKQAMQIVVDMGGYCGDAVTKKTNYLVLGDNMYLSAIRDGKSAKQKRADQIKLTGGDIEVISEDVFIEMISEKEEV